MRESSGATIPSIERGILSLVVALIALAALSCRLGSGDGAALLKAAMDNLASMSSFRVWYSRDYITKNSETAMERPFTADVTGSVEYARPNLYRRMHLYKGVENFRTVANGRTVLDRALIPGSKDTYCMISPCPAVLYRPKGSLLDDYEFSDMLLPLTAGSRRFDQIVNVKAGVKAEGEVVTAGGELARHVAFVSRTTFGSEDLLIGESTHLIYAGSCDFGVYEAKRSKWPDRHPKRFFVQCYTHFQANPKIPRSDFYLPIPRGADVRKYTTATNGSTAH